MYTTPPDIIVGVSEDALNGFLVAHFDNNPEFYDRGRQKGKPIYQLDLNDHGIPRTIKFYAKIQKQGATPALLIDLKQSGPAQSRFEAWWRASHGAGSVTANTKLPPNVVLRVGSAVLQVDFPKLDGSGTNHQVDFHCTITTSAFMLLKDDGDQKVLQLIDWDIVVAGIDDPLDPDDAIWGPGNPACTQELKKLRLMIRDAFTLGANVALTELSKTLTRTIPLPPLDIIHGFKTIPRELYITDQTVAMSAGIEPNFFAAEIARLYEYELQRFNDDLEADGIDLQAVLMAAPQESRAFERYLVANVPAYKTLALRNTSLTRKVRPTPPARPPDPPLPTANLFVMLSSHVFDALAKDLLKADKNECTGWWRPVDILLGYAQGRACYWFKLTDAHGGLSGTTVDMGCNVRAGGGLEIQACIRIPCAPDKCATYKPGIGLKGPLGISLTLQNLKWDDNKALALKARIDDFPGFEIYGLPPVVEDVANALVNWISSIAMRAFLNAVLSLVPIVVIEVPILIPGANVKLTLDQFGAANVSGMLTVTGRTRFGKP